jgi:hypothetical protein
MAGGRYGGVPPTSVTPVGVGGFKGLKGANSFVNKFWEKNLPNPQEAFFPKNSGKKFANFTGCFCK